MVAWLKRRFSSVTVGDERGGVLVFVAVGLFSLLLAAGLAIDVGRGYVLKAQVSRAVDAAALAAAKSLRGGEDAARQRATSVVLANGIDLGVDGINLSLSFGANEFGEKTVSVSATQTIPSFLIRLIGRDEMTALSAAVAAVPPVDLILVLDHSGSLGQAHAWDDLQDAAKQFVRHFDDEIDQMGLVSFNIMAASEFELGQPFIANTVSVVNGMTSVGWTNTGEGLRLAHQQITTGANLRERSAKVVVFFTDGRPTAFRGTLGGRDRVMATSSLSRIYGYYNDPPSLPTTYNPPVSGCRNWSTCFGYGPSDLFNTAEGNGAYWASQIRQANVLVYTIGLGDTSLPPGHILQPGLDYLRLLANEDGVADASQVKGKMYFAPSAGQIRAVFNLVAQDLLARLAQ